MPHTHSSPDTQLEFPEIKAELQRQFETTVHKWCSGIVAYCDEVIRRDNQNSQLYARSPR